MYVKRVLYTSHTQELCIADNEIPVEYFELGTLQAWVNVDKFESHYKRINFSADKK